MASSSHRIEVYSDAELRAQIAREWISTYPTDTQILALTNSAEAATDLHLSLVNERGAWFGVQRFTLNVLAATLAEYALAESGCAPASNLSFTAVVARAIHSLYSKEKLSYFAPVATRPGFPIAVAKTLEELRMSETDPASIARLERGGQDLALIAMEVNEELTKARLSDRAVLFRMAIDSISAPQNAAFAGLPLLLHDLPIRTALENELVRTLAARSPDVLATVPRGDEQTIKALEKSLQSTSNRRDVEVQTAKAAPGRRGPKLKSGQENSLSFAKQHLFEDSAPPVTQLDDSVRLQNWPGEPRECVEIVRSIQAEAAQGVSFDQMAVLLNVPGEYRSHLEEAFSRSQIPAYFVRGTTAPDPAGRAMLALMACAADGLSAKRFAEYLSLGQVPAPDMSRKVESRWVGPDDELVMSTSASEEEPEEAKDVEGQALFANPDNNAVIDGYLRVPARWERLLVDSAVIGGKDRWERRLEGLANELKLRIEESKPEDEARVESIRRQLRDLDALREFAMPLIERLAALPNKASWGEWLAHLRELAVNALYDSDGVMATLAELEPMSSVGPVELHEVQLVLSERLHDLGVKPPKRRYGRVFVGSVDSARGLSFSVVFIPGLAERMFPRKIVEDSILPDAQRLATNLTTRRDQLEAERLGLRIAIGAARDRVYLSYPRIDVQQSRPRVPSFYALEALRSAEGALPGFEEIASRAESTTRARLGWPAPERPEVAIDEAEYDLALLAGLVYGKGDESSGRAHYLITANTHLARALRGRSRRWLRRWSQNDGLVDCDELARQSIARHQFSARSFSATALQNYASCPYRFFLSAILRLGLREEPAAIEVIDPLTRGSIFHETQFEVLTNLKAEGRLPLADTAVTDRHAIEDASSSSPQGLSGGQQSPWLSGTSLDFAFALIDSALDRIAGEYEDRLAPAIPRVWEDGINSIRADLREWLRRMAANNDGWIPDKFELSFGLSDRGPRASDPASVDTAIEVIGDLKLRGAIDMIERQGDRFRVTDHKTGKARAEKETIVGGGNYLQPLLYALACRKLLNGRVESGRLYYCTSDGGYEERVVPLDAANIEILNSVLMTIRQGLVDGFLPAAPDEGACDWCDFRAVCGGFEENRVRLKPRDRLVQLKAMRRLP